LWYSALKYSTLTASSAALTLGGPISAVLSFVFAAKTFTLMQATGLLLLAVGTIFIIGITETFQMLY
jgi:drug/metabolite transporter (DMT)-like permease